MNLPKIFLRQAAVAFALCAGMFLIPAGRAQPAPQNPESRFLFIFNTSADMKKRVPAVQAEMNLLLSSSLGGQLRAGDSIGVWTFDQDLRTGQFPLEHWKPEDAVAIASRINAFVGKQHYAKRTRFDALQPELNQVIQNSERLTVLVFCDGEDEIKLTPYAASINQVFTQRVAGQKKARQPFVLVLRTQFGQYIGCTINFPPGMVTIPEFPPLPTPPAPVKAPPPVPLPAPVVKPPPIGPPLIIVGTKVETNWPPAPTPPPATNPAAVTPANIVPATPTNAVAPGNLVAPAQSTNPVPMPPMRPASVPPTKLVTPPLPPNPSPPIQTNAASETPAGSVAPTNTKPPTPATPTTPVFTPPSNQMASTNRLVLPTEPSTSDHKVAFAIGGALLAAAGGLAALAIFRSRRAGRGSLISRSMRKD